MCPTLPPCWKLLIKVSTSQGISFAIKVTPESKSDFQTIICCGSQLLVALQRPKKCFFFSPKDPSWAPHGDINDKGIIWPFVYKAWRMPTSRKTIRHNWPISTGNNTMHTSNRAPDGHRHVETLQEQNTALSLFFPQTICAISFTPLSFVSMYSYRKQ